MVLFESTDPDLALAWLTEDARRAVVQAVRLGATFDGIRWRAGVEAILAAPDRLLPALVAAHRALAVEVRFAEGLAAIARTDSSPGVRLTALRHLVRRGEADDELLADLESDLDPRVRLEASVARGPTGRDGLRRLVADGSRTWRTRAALALADLDPGPHLAAVEDALVKALSDPELASDAGAALARVGRPVLLPRLGGLADEPAVRAAIAGIRARVDPAAAGRLAVAELDGGGLSVAAGRGGELSESAMDVRRRRPSETVES